MPSNYASYRSGIKINKLLKYVSGHHVRVYQQHLCTLDWVFKTLPLFHIRYTLKDKEISRTRPP